jgi:hypothetical protein
MMDHNDKPEWKTPEMIALVRNKPEEQVLAVCKGGGVHGSFLDHDDKCHSDSGCTTECSDSSPS